MEDQSTPISSLNNKGDESEVVNKILNKYNNLQDGQQSLPEREEQFENRNMNQEMLNLTSDNVANKEHYQKEVQRSSQYNQEQIQQNQQVHQGHREQHEQQYEEEYEEYEVQEIPLWKRIINEIRIPLFIFMFMLLFSNCMFDKYLITKVPFFGNQYNDCNTYGFLLKTFLASIFSYILIKFVKL